MSAAGEEAGPAPWHALSDREESLAPDDLSSSVSWRDEEEEEDDDDDEEDCTEEEDGYSGDPDRIKAFNVS